MMQTPALWASTADDPPGTFSGGTWADLAAATGPADGVNAVFTSTYAPGVAGLHTSGFDAQGAIGTQPTSVDSVAVTVYWHVDAAHNWTSGYVIITDGTTQIGAGLPALAISADAGHSQTVTFSGGSAPDWAQLATLTVVTAAQRKDSPQTVQAFVDAVSVAVSSTP
jgi:hypothetical protein